MQVKKTKEEKQASSKGGLRPGLLSRKTAIRPHQKVREGPKRTSLALFLLFLFLFLCLFLEDVLLPLLHVLIHRYRLK